MGKRIISQQVSEPFTTVPVPNGQACVGKYMDEMETASQDADDPPDRKELRDD